MDKLGITSHAHYSSSSLSVTRRAGVAVCWAAGHSQVLDSSPSMMGLADRLAVAVGSIALGKPLCVLGSCSARRQSSACKREQSIMRRCSRQASPAVAST